MEDRGLRALFLNQEEVVQKVGLTMEKVVEIVEEVLSLHSKKEVLLPSKVVLDLGEREVGRINAMPAYVGGDISMCGIKWISGFPGNPAKYNLPRAFGLIVLNSAETGLPLAIMDGTYISAMRTGAATGVGARYLAREDSKKVCIIGCGVQAITQVKALHVVMKNIKEFRLYDVSAIAANNLKREIEKEFQEYQVKVVSTPEEAVVDADIIVTVTVADEPIVKEAWLKEGVFFSHVGSYQEEEEEVILKADKIVLDEWEQVLHRETPLVAKLYLEGRISDDTLYGDIGEIINGAKKGRENDKENIFFSPIGLGTEDVAVASWVYQRAKEKGLGNELKFFDEPIFHISRRG